MAGGSDVILDIGVNPKINLSGLEDKLKEALSKYEKDYDLKLKITIPDGALDSLKDLESSLDRICDKSKSIKLSAGKKDSKSKPAKRKQESKQEEKDLKESQRRNEDALKQQQRIAEEKARNDKDEAAREKKAEAARKKAAKENEDSIISDAQHALAQYKKYSRMVKKAKDSVKITEDENGNKTYSADDEGYKALADQMNNAERNYRSARKTLDTLNTKRAKDLSRSMDDYDAELTVNRGIASSEAAKKAGELDAKTIAKNKEAYDSAFKEAEAMQSNISDKLNSWSAAKDSTNPEIRAAYDNLEENFGRVTDILDKLKNVDAKNPKEVAAAIKEAAEAFNGLNDEVEKSSTTIKAGGADHKSFAEQFVGLADKLNSWLSASKIITSAIRTARKMVDEAIKVDSAMTQMQIVTGSSAKTMKDFSDVAASAAKDTASSMTDIVSSATTYARLGYSLDESTMLAKYTSMISKVGDIDVSSVQSAVTAIVKAFDIDARDAAGVGAVFDKLITTGNNLPVSVKELAEGLNNAGSSLSAAGNSYEESLALLAASNATVQDISKSSTGLRTITARIRNTKTDLDALGETMTDVEYDNIVQALTGFNVSLTDENGDLRSTFDIMKDIAGVAKDLKQNSPNDYAALAETLAGTRMQNVFFSLVENFGEAEKAMDLMGNSTGALDTAFDTYSNSIGAHVQQMKTQFEELSYVTVNSDFAKFIVDFGSGFMGIATGLQKINMLLPATIALFTSLKSLMSIS